MGASAQVSPVLRESHTGCEAHRLGGSWRAVVVAMVVVVYDSLLKESCPARGIVVGAVGAFCGEPPFEEFRAPIRPGRTSDGVRCYVSSRGVQR